MKIVRCYTDGSYSTKIPGKTGWGVLFEDGKELSGIVDTDSNQIQGECTAVIKAYHYVRDNIQELGEDINLVIFYDYQGLKEWHDSTWKAKTNVAISYQAEIQRSKQFNIHMRFVKVPAANNKADRLSTSALGIESVH